MGLRLISKVVYLGGCQGRWRDKVKEELPDVYCVDPFKDCNQTAIYTFVSKDLAAIEGSDACLFLINYEVYSGACVEIGYAAALGKPIILVYLLRGRVDPMMIGVSRGVYTDLEPAIEKLRRILG